MNTSQQPFNLLVSRQLFARNRTLLRAEKERYMATVHEQYKAYTARINLQHSLIDLLKLIDQQQDQSRFYELVIHIASCNSWDYYWQHLPGVCSALGINICKEAA